MVQEHSYVKKRTRKKFLNLKERGRLLHRPLSLEIAQTSYSPFFITLTALTVQRLLSFANGAMLIIFACFMAS